MISQTVNVFTEDTPASITKEDFLNTEGAVNINNLVIYVRFKGDDEFPEEQNTYTDTFNKTGTGIKSVANYFKEASYNKLDVNTTFYPANNGTMIVSYEDSFDRNYYVPYAPVSNTLGYKNFAERTTREHTLIKNAINFIKNEVPAGLDLDFNNDSRIDNISFIIRGGDTNHNDLLWPHRWSLPFSSNIFINGKQAIDYIFLIEDNNDLGVICHEIIHVFGAPDLYHLSSANSIPVGYWDVMARDRNPPQHPSAYIKHKYCGWISDIPEITSSGTFVLTPLTNSVSNCYKIPIKNSSEYLVLEYRLKTGTFESSLTGSGLIIYRINESYKGNYRNGPEVPGGVYDEVYVFREGGSVSQKGNHLKANFGSNLSRNTFSNTSVPHCFVRDGSACAVSIKNISAAGEASMNFEVDFCDNTDITYSNTSLFPLVTEAVNITTNNAVQINNGNNITFEASREVQLNSNFEVKKGGNFTARIIECGEQ